VINIDTAFSQPLPELTVTNTVLAVPANRPEDDVTLKMPAFEWVHVLAPSAKGGDELINSRFLQQSQIG